MARHMRQKVRTQKHFCFEASFLPIIVILILAREESWCSTVGGIFDIQLTGVVVEAHPPSPYLPGVVVLYMYSIVEPAEAYEP